MKKINFSLTFFLLIFIFLPQACKNEDVMVPYVPVSFTINLNDPKFIDLNVSGNAVYVTGGVRGIIIYRKSQDQFSAYDRCCTFDPDVTSAKVFFHSNPMEVIDTVCGSTYSLVFDGMNSKGPAKYPLKQYQTLFDPTWNTLYVYN